jgi:hypothetical protein
MGSSHAYRMIDEDNRKQWTAGTSHVIGDGAVDYCLDDGKIFGCRLGHRRVHNGQRLRPLAASAKPEKNDRCRSGAAATHNQQQ